MSKKNRKRPSGASSRANWAWPISPFPHAATRRSPQAARLPASPFSLLFFPVSHCRADPTRQEERLQPPASITHAPSTGRRPRRAPLQYDFIATISFPLYVLQEPLHPSSISPSIIFESSPQAAAFILGTPPQLPAISPNSGRLRQPRAPSPTLTFLSACCALS